MSKATEKAMKGLQAFIDENATPDMDEDELNGLVDEYMQRYNRSLDFNEASEPETADDFVELAEEAESDEEAYKYAKRALELEPDNLDAERIAAHAGSKDLFDMLHRVEQAVMHGNEVMEKQGFMTQDYIGEFWQILETRPYMRLRHSYMDLLVDCGMMRKAVSEGEDMLRLNENDNQGIRYVLMHLYAFLEEEDAALKIHKRYEEHEETQMLLPLSMLYFKLGDWEKAEEYLKRLAKANKDTKKFMRALKNEKLDKYLSEMNPYGYQPFTIQELMMELIENEFLFREMSIYILWADERLKKRK